MDECSRESSERARDTETEEHPSIDMLPQQHESLCRSNQMRNGNSGDGDFSASLDRQERRKQATDPETRHRGHRGGDHTRQRHQTAKDQ